MTRMYVFSVSALFAMLLGTVLYFTDTGREWLPEALQPELEPVVVFVLGSPRAVAQIRAAIRDERVVAETPEAFAVVEGRVLAASAEPVGELLMQLGWDDRPLDLVPLPIQIPLDQRAPSGPTVARSVPDETGPAVALSPAPSAGLTPEERRQKIQEILNKPSVNLAEQLFLLDNTGL